MLRCYYKRKEKNFLLTFWCVWKCQYLAKWLIRLLVRRSNLLCSFSRKHFGQMFTQFWSYRSSPGYLFNASDNNRVFEFWIQSFLSCFFRPDETIRCVQYDTWSRAADWRPASPCPTPLRWIDAMEGEALAIRRARGPPVSPKAFLCCRHEEIGGNKTRTLLQLHLCILRSRHWTVPSAIDARIINYQCPLSM